MHRIGFIVSQGTSVMGFAAVSVFEVANILKGEEIYDVHFLSERGGSIPTSIGMRVETEPFGNIPLDTLIVAGVGLIEPTPARLCAASSRAMPTRRGHLHRRLRAGRGGPARRTACDHPLASRARTAGKIPEGEG